MKILLTGSSGFIGRHLLRILNDEHSVDAPSSQQLDLCNYEKVCAYFEHRHYDVVIHAAGHGREIVSHRDPLITQKITNMFYSLYANRHKFNKFINLGSGAEFGLSTPCIEKKEYEIYQNWPLESYGLAKNIIARTVAEHDYFYHIRVFGCFDPSEAGHRLFSKFKNHQENNKPFHFENRQFDFITLEDLGIIIEEFTRYNMRDQSVNAVYMKKFTIEQLLKKFCDVNDLDPQLIKIASESNLHYTGNGQNLDDCQIPLQGLEKTIKAYYE